MISFLFRQKTPTICYLVTYKRQQHFVQINRTNKTFQWEDFSMATALPVRTNLPLPIPPHQELLCLSQFYLWSAFLRNIPCILPSKDSQSCWEEGRVGRALALYSNTTEFEMIWLLKATCKVTSPVSWAKRKVDVVRQRTPCRTPPARNYPVDTPWAKYWAEVRWRDRVLNSIFVTRQFKSPKYQLVYSDLEILSLRVIKWVVLAKGRITCVSKDWATSLHFQWKAEA